MSAAILAARARYLRADVAGLTADEFGERLGLSAASVLRIEEGQDPSDRHLQLLLDLRLDAIARGAACALRESTIEEMRAAAATEAARAPARTAGRAA